MGTTQTYIIPIEEKKTIEESPRRDINDHIPFTGRNGNRTTEEKDVAKLMVVRLTYHQREEQFLRRKDSFKEFDNIHAKRRKQTD